MSAILDGPEDSDSYYVKGIKVLKFNIGGDTEISNYRKKKILKAFCFYLFVKHGRFFNHDSIQTPIWVPAKEEEWSCEGWFDSTR